MALLTDDRFRNAEYAAWVGIVGNLALVLAKGTVGWLANSKALMADAVHSASDTVGAIAVLTGIRDSKRNRDRNQTIGQSKAAPVAAIIVTVILMLFALEIGISSIKALYAGVTEPPEWSAFVMLLISVIVRETMFRYKFRLGTKMKSQALIANAWEHRSDVYASLTAAIGVLGAILGGILDMPWLYVLDSAAGLVVSFLVLKTGYSLIKETVSPSRDETLRREDEQELLQAVHRVKGVITVDELHAREQGHYVIVDMKISVNPRITVMEGHDIAKTVKHMLMTRFIHVADVFIHVHPYDPGYPYKNNVDPQQDDAPTLLH
ncbi:cation diffusion facilitator family transporter [Paenibacillus chartarius]|uniref:Cation diffusion facilitator family transporter n=1 Tax=Paenibacillus chartarius TaxID=747481 RepID=A0ABV6DIS4_9BACL